MLNIIIVKGSKYVSLVEFYDHIFGAKTHYSRWVKFYVTEHNTEMPVKGLDYLDLDELPLDDTVIKKGPYRKDYLISIDFLKQLCFDLKTKRCKDVRAWANTIHNKAR